MRTAKGNNISDIFKLYYKELCFAVYQIVLDFDEAEDIAQDIFFKVLTKDKLKEVENVRAYLLTIARNESLKRLRNTNRHMPLEDGISESIGSEESKLIETENKIKLFKIIEKLPTQRRKIFLLCTLDGMSYQDVADSLEISVNTVKTQMKQAYKFLRESLSDFYTLILLTLAFFQIL